MANYCLSKIDNQQTISILEPSVGDGAFINAISKSQELERFETINNTVVEKENDELQKVIEEKNATIDDLNTQIEDLKTTPVTPVKRKKSNIEKIITVEPEATLFADETRDGGSF